MITHQHLILLVMLSFVVLTTNNCSGRPLPPTAVQGVLDVSDWDFAEKGKLALDGEWEFYWNKLYTPEDFQRNLIDEKKDYIDLPGLWKGTIISDKELPAKGYATYRLIVRVKPDETTKALKISRPLSVCQVWVNGRVLAKSGQTGTDQISEKPRNHIIIRSFSTPKESIEIVLQVSNHHNIQGGMNDAIVLGAEQQILASSKQRWIITAMLSGAFFVMALFHFTLYALRKSEANVYFGLYCLMISIRTLSGDQGVCLIEALIPGLPWRATIDLSIIPGVLAIPLLVMFYHSLFPFNYSRFVEKCYLLISSALIVYVLATPPNAYDIVMLIPFVMALTAFIYLFVRFIRDLIVQKEDAGLLIPGFLILFICFINDILFELHILDTTALIPFGRLFFILSYSFLISLRFSRAASNVEKLSSELVLRKQTELDLKVMQRRLSEMLHAVDDALLAVNASKEISFCNRAFEKVSGYRVEDLLGTSFISLLHAPQTQTACTAKKVLEKTDLSPGETTRINGLILNRPDKGTFEGNLLVTSIELDDELLFLFILRNKLVSKNNLPGYAMETIRNLNRNKKWLSTLEKSLSTLDMGRWKETEAVVDDLRTIDTLFDHLDKNISHDSPVEMKRIMAVKVMNLSLDYWTASTQTSKIELSDQSRIWNIYFEKDGYARTQTLDRYLRVESLPQKPRWKQILATADFVLAGCQGPSSLREQLEKTVVQFRETI